MATYVSNNPMCDGFVYYPPNYYKNTTSRAIYLRVPPTGSDFRRTFIPWSISAIPDTATVTKVEVMLDIYHVLGPARDAQFKSLDSNPCTSAGVDIWSDIDFGTTFLQQILQLGSQQTFDLGQNGVNDLQSKLQAGEDWFGVGIKFAAETQDGADHFIAIRSEEAGRRARPPPTLKVQF